MPRVSVIVPAYNAALFLPEALDSVLRQSYADWEIVVADDGSTDQTRAVVETRITSFGGRMRYIYQKNRGVSAARNSAIRAAQGELIALLDADDIWLEQRLERGVAMLDAHPEIGLVHAQVVRIDAEGKIIEKPPIPAEEYLSGRISKHIYARRAHLLSPTILFRRHCLNAAGLFDETALGTEDRDLWFRIARLCDIGYLSEVLAYYRIVPGSLSRNWEHSRTSQVQFLKKHYHTGQVTAREYRQGFANIYRERGDVLFNDGALGESIRSYAEAVSYDPRNAGNVYMLLRALGEPLIARLRRTAHPVESKA